MLGDFGAFFKVPLNVLKAFIWSVPVLVRPHFAFKVHGKWKCAFLSDFIALLRVALNALKAFIWPLLVSVRLHFAFKVLGIDEIS